MDDVFRRLVEHLPHAAVVLFDTDSTVLVAAGEVFHGRDDVVGRPVGADLPSAARDLLGPLLAAALRGEAREAEHVASRGGGIRRTRAVPVRDAGRVVGGLLVSEDVSLEREALEGATAAHAFSSAVLAASPDVVSIMDVLDGSLVWTSRSLVGVLGWTGEQVTAMGPSAVDTLVVADDRQRVRASILAVQDAADGDAIHVRYRALAADGSTRWMSRRATPFLRDDAGAVTQALAVTRDVTDVVRVEEQLRHSALHDPLTGLPNRALLVDRLAGALARGRRDGTETAVLFCDLDGFKRVNDTGGHGAGDTVLAEVAGRLKALLRPGDTVARVGGDEFVVVLEPPTLVPRQRGDTRPPALLVDPDATRAAAVEVADRVRAAVSRPVVVGGSEHVVSVSIGITLSRPGTTADDLLRDSDTAMYRAKERGKNRSELFDEGLRAHVMERDRVERVLRAAMSDLPGTSARLTVAYQPVRDVRTGRLVAAEALARLADEAGDAVAPDVFIDVAEDTGLIHELGRRVLLRATTDLAHWRALPGGSRLTVAVNLSARQAQQADVSALVRDALSAGGLPAEALTLELTESVLLQAGPSTLRQMGELHASGVRIAIDDFGTGYASLRYLATLPVSQVKIDRSFVAGLPDDPTSATIVRAVAGLARDLGLECVAEGIETPEQRAALPAGVLGQGWLLGRPMTAAMFGDLLGTPHRR